MCKKYIPLLYIYWLIRNRPISYVVGGKPFIGISWNISKMRVQIPRSKSHPGGSLIELFDILSPPNGHNHTNSSSKYQILIYTYILSRYCPLNISDIVYFVCFTGSRIHPVFCYVLSQNCVKLDKYQLL